MKAGRVVLAVGLGYEPREPARRKLEGCAGAWVELLTVLSASKEEEHGRITSGWVMRQWRGDGREVKATG